MIFVFRNYLPISKKCLPNVNYNYVLESGQITVYNEHVFSNVIELLKDRVVSIRKNDSLLSLYTDNDVIRKLIKVRMFIVIR